MASSLLSLVISFLGEQIRRTTKLVLTRETGLLILIERVQLERAVGRYVVVARVVTGNMLALVWVAHFDTAALVSTVRVLLALRGLKSRSTPVTKRNKV